MIIEEETSGSSVHLQIWRKTSQFQGAEREYNSSNLKDKGKEIDHLLVEVNM